MFSKKVANINSVLIGGSESIKIQTMYDDKISTCDVDLLLKRILKLKLMGCDLLRFSYINSDDKEKFSSLCKKSCMPLVADIHFDYKMAIEALEAGAHKIRINPGNIGARWKVDEVVKCAKDNNAAIRIGLNSGSLPKSNTIDKSYVMINSALEYLSWFEKLNFYNTVVSLKASSTDLTMDTNRKFKELCDYPLHIGVTEAGGLIPSLVKSTWALGSLLNEQIGDTIRISITDSIENEIQSATELLRILKLRNNGINIVSCPRCGRHTFDTHGFLKDVEKDLLIINKNITVAIMGCNVNGPGEARSADIAIAGFRNDAYLYSKGNLIKKVNIQNAKEELLKVINAYE